MDNVEPSLMLQSGLIKYESKGPYGILGGAFDPPHVGHLYVAKNVHKIIKTRIWWTVTWKNSLKKSVNGNNFVKRVEDTRELIKYIVGQQVCEIEKSVRSSSGLQTIRTLRKRYRRNNFIWIMGTDSFLNLHRWRRFKEFIRGTPIIVVSRASYNDKNVMSCKSGVIAKRGYRRSAFEFVYEARGSIGKNYLWTHLRVRPMLVSSTNIRNRGTYFNGQ